ncbi:MAG TPA: tetratricopeptide repeat protein [bacterium]|nr:tetratricopeptide repeat protein [bacterium]
MSTDNDRLLELIGKGDTLQALNLLFADASSGSTRLAMNRALYGPSSEEAGERIRAADQEQRTRLGGLSGDAQATALYNLGCFALNQDDVMEARLRFAEALELQPGHLMARHNLAYAHELLAETDDARREYAAVLAQNPDCLLTRLNLAQLALSEGDYETGLDDLEALYRDDPGNMGVLLYLCRGLLLRASPPDLERVLALLGENPAAERYVDLNECRAYALYLMGDLDAAEAAFRQLLDVGGDNLFALTGIIKVLGQRDDLTALQPYVERYRAQHPSEAVDTMLQDLKGE